MSCLVAVGFFVWTISRISSGFHEIHGATTAVSLSPSQDKTLYSSDPDASLRADSSDCRITGPGEHEFKKVFGSQTLGKNGKTWYAIAHVHVTKEGDYHLTCRDSGEAAYALGSKFTVAGVLGGIAGLFVIPGLGFVAGGIIVLVTALRRHGHKKRLTAVSGSAGPGPWPPPGPGRRPPT